MNVGELKQLLASVPDDTLVVVETDCMSYRVADAQLGMTTPPIDTGFTRFLSDSFGPFGPYHQKAVLLHPVRRQD